MIKFNYQTNFTFKQRRLVKQWLVDCVTKLGKSIGEISYVFCTDDYIKSINQQCLQHDYVTDIITFDYSESSVIFAEIYMAPMHIKSNALDYNTRFRDEFHRVLIHGILHLSGYDDITDKEKTEMREMEDYCLGLRNF